MALRLFQSFRDGNLVLKNRVVMAPMTRSASPGGIIGDHNIEYYRRRAEGGVGLIITEGVWIDSPVAAFMQNIPNFYGEKSLRRWRELAEAVHGEGAKIMPQLWHVGMARTPGVDGHSYAPSHGPSGIDRNLQSVAPPMTKEQIESTIEAYARGAADAADCGFDGVELHGAHGYLIDQFFWNQTNRRSDEYGGDWLNRTRFAANIVREIKKRVGDDFPVCLRFSQWKFADYKTRLLESVADLEALVTPLVSAGVDMFHVSTRRFWESAFPDSPLTLAAWTRKLSGRPTIAVGSVSLSAPYDPKAKSGADNINQSEATNSIDAIETGLANEDFDLIAVGRALISNPDWAQLVSEQRMDEIKSYDARMLETLA
ncbi:MAG: 12-oxophytodienoate reductase [Amphiplicatus sp.]